MLRDNWTTFLKARLNCSLPGEYPFYFDEIQGITYLPDDGLVYATFTTPRYGIQNVRFKFYISLRTSNRILFEFYCTEIVFRDLRYARFI